MVQCCITHLHLCRQFLKILIFSSELWGKKILRFFTFSWIDSLYTISKLTPFVNHIHIKTCSVLFQYTFWWKTNLGTIWRGLQTSKHQFIYIMAYIYIIYMNNNIQPFITKIHTNIRGTFTNIHIICPHITCRLHVILSEGILLFKKKYNDNNK